jgi:anti-sigma-K factor RskA
MADLHTLAGAYALDAVDDIERAAFARHLGECETCAVEVAELREAAVRLGTLAQEIPPAGLRGNVLAEIGRTRQVPPIPPAGPALPANAGMARRRWVRWGRRGRVAVAAVAACVLALSVGTVAWTIADGRSRIAALEAERARMYDVFNAPDVSMKGTNVPNGGRIAAAVAPSVDAGVAMLAGLPALPTGEVFQMWLMNNAETVSAGVIPHGQTGGTLLFDWHPGSERFGLSVEPQGGSKSPSALLGQFNLFGG